MFKRMWLLSLMVLTCTTAVLADDPVTIKPKYQPGQYLTTVQMDNKSVTKVGGQDIATDTKQTMEIVYDVAKPDDAGNVVIQMKFRRFAQTVNGPMGEMSFDSAKPDEGNQDLGKALLPLTKASIKLTVGADGTVKEVSGLSEMWDKMDLPAAAKAQMKQNLGDKMISGMIQQQTAALPSKPVSVGESWKSEQEMAVPMLGQMKPDLTITLKEVKQSESGKRAVLVTAGKIVTEGKEMDMGGASMTIKKMTLNVNSTGEVDLDDVLLNESTTSTDGEMQMEMGPEGSKQQMDIKFKVNVKSVGKKLPPSA